MADLSKFSKDGKVGYKDTEGIIVIEPQFDDGVYHFGLDSCYHTEFACVSLNGKCGLINESGELVLPFDYQEICDLTEGYFAVREADSNAEWRSGVITLDRITIVPIEYKYIRKIGNVFNCYQKAFSYKEYKTALFYEYKHEQNPVIYNTKGKCIFEGLAVCYDYGFLVVEKDQKYGVLKEDGTVVIDIKYDEIVIASSNRFIVRQNEGESWAIGVLDALSKTIIGFNYKYISTKDGQFFNCFEESTSFLMAHPSNGKRYEYRNNAEEYWLNSSGQIIFKGKADALSDSFLACDKDGKKAVIGANGERIVNFLYDTIHLLGDYFVVINDGRIGLLSNSGSVVLDTSYESIEFVHIDDMVFHKYVDYGHQEVLYGDFNHNNVFDTAVEKNQLYRQIFRIANPTRVGLPRIQWEYPHDHYSFDDIMIVRSSSYAELFSLEEGVLHNSRFDTIQQLTSINFVVSSKGKYGVYRRDIHKLFIPCEYDRIVFEGGDVVLLCKNELWGAALLDPEINPFYPVHENDIDVPVKYKEIAILNDAQTLFGVKQVRVDYYGKEYEEYTIVNQLGKKYERIDSFTRLSSMPVLYEPNHILTSYNGKFGFVSARGGYVSIPFIYDECKERPDSLFDVRIDNRWGVIDLFGEEIVSIKYKDSIYNSRDAFDDTVVVDATSGRYGVLGADGKEKVPTIYDHIMNEDSLIFCGYGGSEYISSKCPDNNFFCGEISGATWGVCTKKGIQIINPAYDCFKEQDGFILAGRDGGFLCQGQLGSSYREEEYGGVYDLYDYNGNMFIGGFNKFIRDKERALLLFHFGGEWEQECGEYDYYNYHFYEGNGRWLITDENLSSIIPKQDGSKFQFRKGAKCRITKKKENDRTVSYWSFPLELFSVKKPVFENELMIIGDDKTQRVIRLEDGLMSSPYNVLKIINSNLFFTYNHNDQITGVGISSLNEQIVKCDEQYSLLTVPVQNYVFAVKTNDYDNYSLFLLNTQNPTFRLSAIAQLDFSKLSCLLTNGDLQLLPQKEGDNTPRITVRNKDVFDNDFCEQIDIEENNCEYDKKSYWFSVEYVIYSSDDDDTDSYDDYGRDDDWDYERETWYAMTDGMYGDMPEGFDGDYDFLGR